MNKYKKYLSLTLALTLIMGLAVTGIAIAQDNPDAKPGTRLHQIYLEKLAGVLGIDQNQLLSNLKTAGQQTVDTAVAEGLITSDQAEKMKQAIEAGQFPGMFGMRGSNPGMNRGMNMDTVASALGMTLQEVMQEFKIGKSLQQLATEKGISLDQIKDQLLSAEKSKLDEAVAQGKLTQDKADQILDRLQQLDLQQLNLGKFHGRTR